MAATNKTAPVSGARKKAASKAKKSASSARRAAAPKKVSSKKTASKKAVSKKAAGAKATAKKKATAGKRAAGAAKGKSDAGYNDRSAWEPVDDAAPSSPSQPMMKALYAEHRHMASVMQLFAGQLDAIEAGDLVDTHVLYEVMDYMVTWPDRFHHPREDLIYNRVAELDKNAADEVDTLQHDHDSTAERGKNLLRDIERWRGGKLSGPDLLEGGRAYIRHIYGHMNVEEQVVFPHIERVLTLQDWRELAEDDQLAAVAAPIFGPRVQREFRNLTRKLRRSLRSSVEQGTMVEWIGIEALMESMDVVSMAYESAVDSAGEHLRDALRDSKDIFFDTPVLAPIRVAANNARLTMSLFGDVRDISRETFNDLSRVNQERLDRVRLLQRNSRRS